MSFITHNLRQLQESVVTVLQNRAAQPAARPRQRLSEVMPVKPGALPKSELSALRLPLDFFDLID